MEGRMKGGRRGIEGGEGGMEGGEGLVFSKNVSLTM